MTVLTSLLCISMLASGVHAVNISSKDADSQIIYLNPVTGNDNWDGTDPTWQTGITGPKKTIKSALEFINENGVLFLCPGIYYEHDLTIENSVKFRGDNATIIDSYPEGALIWISNGHKVSFTGINFEISDSTVHSSILFNSHSTVLLDNCTFKGNNNGCAVNNWRGNLHVLNCQFSEFNTAIKSGTGTVHLKICEFRNNNAKSNGGAIDSYGGPLFINNCNFANNSAYKNGGAIYIKKGDLRVKNSFFSYNIAGIIDKDGHGGAIHIENCQLVNSLNIFTKNYNGKGAIEHIYS